MSIARNDGGSVGLAGAVGLYLVRGLALAGLTNDASLAWWFDEFIQENAAAVVQGWSQFISGTGAHLTGVAATAGGVVRLTTGATAASISSASTTAGAIVNEATTRWYFAARFRIPLAVDAVAIVNAGLVNFANTKTLMLGFNGALNAANFIAQYDGNFAGSALNLGVAVDTAFHVFEMYSLGDGLIRARIDGGAEVSAAQVSAPPDSMFLSIQARNGVTPSDRRLEIDWILTAGPRG